MDAASKTLVHELAHELMRQLQGAAWEPTLVELEAEAVAYVAGTQFGLECAGSPNHIALHGATAEMILDHLHRT